MNLKNARLFPNSQRQLTQEKVSHTLHKSAQNNVFTDGNLLGDELHNTATNNFLVMFESEIKRHWGI